MQAQTYSIIEAVQDFGPIVHVDEDLGFIFCWNRNHTFNVLTKFNDRYQVVDAFQNYDVERTGLFADRATVKEAFDYAFDVISRLPSSEQIAATTAMYVVLNTISKEIEKNEAAAEEYPAGGGIEKAFATGDHSPKNVWP